MKDDFKLIIESIHCPGGPDLENVRDQNLAIDVQYMTYFSRRPWHYPKINLNTGKLCTSILLTTR